jgi:proline racemase
MTKHKAGTVKVTINYGYDIHSIVMSQRSWDRIAKGEAVTMNGQGFFIQGVESEDVWTYNSPEAGALSVDAEDGHQIFIGHMSAASTQTI